MGLLKHVHVRRRCLNQHQLICQGDWGESRRPSISARHLSQEEMRGSTIWSDSSPSDHKVVLSAQTVIPKGVGCAVGGALHVKATFSSQALELTEIDQTTCISLHNRASTPNFSSHPPKPHLLTPEQEHLLSHWASPPTSRFQLIYFPLLSSVFSFTMSALGPSHFLIPKGNLI